MRVTIDRQAFVDGLLVVSRAASTRSANPALAGILAEATGETLRLRATTGDMGLSLEVPARVEAEGTQLLPGRLLADVARSLPMAEVSLEHRASEEDVELVCGGSRFHLRTLPALDFPRLPEPEGEAVSLPADVVVEAVERVAPAASRDEVRLILTGILVKAAADELVLVSTDSYRLAVRRASLESPVGEAGIEAVIPATTMRELARLAQESDGSEIRAYFPGERVVFEVGSTQLSSRLMDGQFPNYEQLLPESFEHELRFDLSELTEAATRVSRMALQTATLKLAFAQGEVTVSAATADVGDASETLPVAFDGEPIEISFNPGYFIDGLKVARADEIVLKLSSALRPGLLEPADGDGFQYLVMPMRPNS